MEGICHMEHTEAEQELQLVTFRLANEEYGLPITKVQEIKSSRTSNQTTPNPILYGRYHQSSGAYYSCY